MMGKVWSKIAKNVPKIEVDTREKSNNNIS